MVNFRPTHEGVAGGNALVRFPVGFFLLHEWSRVALLVGRAVKEISFGELHQDSGGAQIEMFRQDIVPLFRAGQAAAVGVDIDRPLINQTT